jgi:hypothetical protein
MLALALLVSACGGSPKARARDMVTYLPEEIGEWELADRTELLTSTITSMGHITLSYEGPDDAIAYIVVEAHPSEDAADVAMVSRERELQLDGLTLEADRAPQQTTAQLAQTDRVRYALLKEGDLVVEIDAIAAEGEDPVSDDNFAALLDAVRGGLAMTVED